MNNYNVNSTYATWMGNNVSPGLCGVTSFWTFNYAMVNKNSIQFAVNDTNGVPCISSMMGWNG